jgi:hypothetical protein
MLPSLCHSSSRSFPVKVDIVYRFAVEPFDKGFKKHFENKHIVSRETAYKKNHFQFNRRERVMPCHSMSVLSQPDFLESTVFL